MRMQNTTIKTTRVTKTPSTKPTAIFIRSPSYKYDKIRAHTGADHSFRTLIFRDRSKRRLAYRSIGLNGASPHACGGASHDVTHGRRKYHNLRKRFMACSLPKLPCGGGGASLGPGRDPPFCGGVSLRARRLAQRLRNVSGCPFQLS